jgi:hypothetical protein
MEIDDDLLRELRQVHVALKEAIVELERLAKVIGQPLPWPIRFGVEGTVSENVRTVAEVLPWLKKCDC